MDMANHMYSWLDLLDRPAFCVKNGVIVAANAAAKNRLLRIGTTVQEIVGENRAEYETFANGSLYLTIHVSGQPYNASVTRTKEYDVFVLQQEADDDHLQTLALAAQQLRVPLSNVMAVTDQLLATLDSEDPLAQQHASQINRGLFQLLRIVCNMSDAGCYQATAFSNKQTVDMSVVIDEIMEKAQLLADTQNICLQYTGLPSPVWCLVNSEKIERAVYNLLSNAIKFARSGTSVEVKLSKNENKLSFIVCNIEDESVNALSFWNRYRREPAVEDTRFGLGLGMTLVSSVAAAHGGTVLVDHPLPNQTRVTMTITITTETTSAFRSPILQIGDYAGGLDKGLLEFSEILSTESYKKIN